MKKTLRPYQKEELNKLCVRLKETSEPLVVNASVGAGKSLIIAELLLIMQRAGFRALCLTMNSRLIRQNTETYIIQGGNAGIFCAAIGKKETENPIIFASPMSVRMDIKSSGKLSKIPFNLIIIDECHNINYNNPKTIYMRIFNHYRNYAQLEGHKLRFVGLTGTPYRGKGESIIGENQFFKEEVCSISTDFLIENNYLVKPIFGACNDEFNFSKLNVNRMGKFNQKELNSSIKQKPRLTAEIMVQVQGIVSRRKGAFIFASTIEHCQECASWLPVQETAIITGETPEDEREYYINEAKKGIIKYLINVNVLTTGVDIPLFDTIVFVRPTESLVLYIQCLGRGLRLHEDKKECLILDYAGNLERHGDIDNIIINEALKPKIDDDPDYCFPCYDCNTLNKVTARRCIGVPNNKRCDYYFEFKSCDKCTVMNDKTSRYCRECGFELIDPNAKLKKEAATKNHEETLVKSCSFSISNDGLFQILYKVVFVQKKLTTCIKETYRLNSQKSLNIFYAKFIKLHCRKPSEHYMNLDKINYLKKLINNRDFMIPEKLIVEESGDYYKIIKKLFVLEEPQNTNIQPLSIPVPHNKNTHNIHQRLPH